MNGIYVYTPAIWTPLVAVSLLTVIGWYAWRHHDVPGGKPFIAMSALSILVLLGIAFEAVAVVTTAKFAAYKFQYVLLVTSTFPVTCFVLDYVYPGRYLTRRNLILLSIIPLACLLLVLVDHSRLVWSRLEVGADGSVVPYFSTAGNILTVFAAGLALMYAVIFVRLFIRSPQYRWPVTLMLLGQIAARTAFFLDNAHLKTFSPVYLSVLVVILPWITYCIATFSFHILDPLPAARRKVIEQMYAGMVVLDAKWRVVSLNPVAERIFGLRTEAARGSSWQQLASQSHLTALPDLAQLAGASPESIEMIFGSGAEARYYEPALSPLKDFRGLLLGYLLVLHDITESKRFQAQQAQVLWAQATLQERQQLADELHDGLSQNLAFLNLQAQAAQVYMQSGQGGSAQASLMRLTDAAGQIQEDTRQMIDTLLSVSQPSENFCTALRRILADFESQTGLATHLALPGESAEDCFDPARLPPSVAVQLIRISQEALMNVRKHARGASQVRVELKDEAGQLLLTIWDDGCGFDPASQPGSRNHFGLQIMGQRAARIGGQVRIDSLPGKSTQVEVRVPLPAEKQVAIG